MANRVKLYFDCVSPWSYVAFHVLRRYRTAWDMEVDFCPRSLSYIMKHANNKPPVTVPNKGVHLFRELGACDRMYGLPIALPTSFPFETFALMGFLRKVKDEFPEKLEHLIESCLDAVWREGKPLQSAEQIRAHVAPSFLAKEEALSRILEFAASRDARRQQNAEGEALVEEGAFGFPWMVATRALDSTSMPVFGVDHMEHLAAFFHKPYLGPMANGITPRL